MSKQLNIDLNFRANTAQAQQSIQQLQSSLTQIAAAGSLGIGGEKITTEMKQAGQAAKELQMHLTKAFNATTGKLDLNKLNNSLLSSKTTLSSLSKDLMAIGPSGTQAFTQLATSISQANAPMITLNSLFSNLWITMKNTAKWQLTSSMIHGFVGGIQEAYHYAQDLNKSLNNIRIVTGLSVEEMDKFAEKANKAAKALNASTLDYTEAALIYYQQGLRGKAVEERADTTVKMANVTRQSAEEVSDQLTAIWNNFYDGSESLESFADKMVALGAATASSSDEIAGGLEKFAAIGETIGLSFDYAAAALATITSNTRQSEEVVGTALKTIFARMQGLKLGETLEDGVELNKYSQALETIGVDIFDANDQLKNMDQILDETAAKWGTLTKAQQMATAQTVAGIRQYNQFIALMDNWNNGDDDSMVANLQTANTASGALQEQADIYAESWEAAQDRVTASAEAIYQALLDDDFFIGLANMWGDALGGIKEFVDGIGGLKGVFGIAITFITSALASRLGPAIDNIRANFQVMFSSASTQANKLATEMHDMIGVAQQQTGIDASKSQQIQLDNANNLIVAKTKLASVNKNLSSHERMLAEMNISLIESEQQKALSIAETIDKLKEESAVLKETMSNDSTAAGMAERMMSPVDRRFGQLEDQKMQAVASGDRAQITETNNALMALNSQYENIMFSANAAAKAISTEFVAGLEKGGNEIVEGNIVLKEYIASLTEFANKNVSHMTTPESLSNARMIVTEYASTLPDAVTKTEDFQKALSALGRVGINGGANSAEQMKKAILNLVQAMGDAKFSTADLRKMMIQLGQGTNVKKFEADIQNLNKKEKELLETQQRLNKAVESFDPTHKFGKIEKITAFGSALMSVSMIYNSLKSAVASWTDPDISFGEKLMTSFMSIGMILPMLSSGFNNVLKMIGLMNLEQGKQILQTFAVVAANAVEIQSLTALENAKQREIALTGIRNNQTDEEIIASMMAANADLTEAQAKEILNGVKTKETALTKLQTAADNGNLVAKAALFLLDKAGITIEAGGLVVKEGTIAATIAETVANWGLNASMTPLIVIIGLLIASLAALTLIIWGVVSAIKAITDAYNADAIAAEQAAKYAEVMTEKYNKLTEEANKFKEAVSNYDTAVDALKDLEKGTDEYAAAIEEANKKAKELIEMYGLWNQTDGFDENGVIKFKEGALEGVQAKKDSAARQAEMDMYAAKISANSAKIKSERTDLKRDVGSVVGTGTYNLDTGQEYTRQFTDDEMDSIVQAFAGLENAASMSEEMLREYLTEQAGLSPAITEEIDAIMTNKDAFLALTTSVEQATAANENYARELVGGLVEEEHGDRMREMATDEKTGEVDEDAYNKIKNAATDAFAKADKENQDSMSAKISKIDVSDVTSTGDLKKYSEYAHVDSDEELMREYAKVVGGYSDEEVANMQYKGGTGKGTLKDQQGNEVFKEVNDEYMRQQLAKTAEINEIKEEYKNKETTVNGVTETQYMDALENFANSGEQMGEKYGADFNSALLNSLQNGTETIDLSSIFGDLSQAEVTELQGLSAEELIAQLGLSAEDLKALGYENAQEFQKKFNEGLTDWNQESASEAAASSLGMSTEAFQQYVNEIKKGNKYLSENEDEARRVAKAQIELQRKVKSVSEVYEKNSAALDKNKRGTEEFSTACADMSTALNSVFGDGVFNADLVADNLDTVKKAMEGDVAAMQQLQDIAGEQILIDADVDLSDGSIGDKVNDWIGSQEFNDLEIGASLNDSGMYESFQALLDSGEMTVDEMNKLLSGVGFDPQIDYIDVPLDQAAHNEDTNTYTVKYLDSEGNEQTKTLTAEQYNEAKGAGKIQIPVINSKGTKKVGTPKAMSKATNGGGGGGGGGGSNKPSKPKTVKSTESKKKNDEVERYHEINQELEDLQNTLDDIADLKDEAWGADKLAAMDKEKKKLQEITTSHKKYQAEIAKNLNDDRWEAETKYGAQIDPTTGRITNYEELQEQWMNEWNAESQRLDALEQDYENKIAVASDEEKEGLEEEKEKNVTEVRKNLDDDYEAKRKAIEQYEETLNLSEEAQRQLDDYLRQIRELNYEELEYKLEIRVELNENDIADIEHQLERLGDNNVYASAEHIALIEKNAASYRNIADAQIESMREAERLYQEFLNTDGKSGISKEDYMARLQESKEALQEAEMSIRDGIQQIGEELSNTFDLVDEKLDQQFTKFDQMIELMDHYKNIVSLTEGEASYKEFNKILKASQEVLRDRIAADESEVAMWTARREQLEADMKGMNKNSPEYLAAEEALNNIMEKEADAKSQLMADIEQLGEYAQEIFENAIEQAKIDFEEAMFGGRLSSVIDSIDMLNAKQEEVLTTTNKIYETNKMLRNIEKDIEATTNNRAKQAYAEFQNKVKQKQEQNELTQFELDLLNAEYEITKAQIALEEAQNAKDTVRLTRDSEGNYGYVYTANEDKVADAEQALDDATNNYYNTALEGAQKYQDQIYQHIEEWEEKVTEVMMDQTLSEEEKNKKIAEINATYDEMIRRDKELYYIAIDGIRDSSYNTQVDYDLKGIASAENWFDECDGFIEDLKEAQWNYDDDTKEIATHTEENFGKMSDAIDGTKKASQKLVEDMTKSGGIIDTCNNELKNSIDNATLAWQKYIEALEEVIRLTDEAMKKNHDTQLKDGYKEDYAAEISKRLANGADYTDYDIQQLLQYRWDKMGGVDNTDYQALINGGGTAEQIALWEVLRRFKIDKTDWSSVEGDWAKDIRATKMDQDFAQLITNYFKSSSHARWSDETVQGYLAARQAKINEGHESAKDAMSNEELKSYVAQLLNKKPEELFTGGYTGSWGPEGKLAVLHEKELVLNAHDTENFLSATNILREISQMLDRDALIASLGAINLRAMTLNSPADQVLQQEVTIHADFPNVTDHNEIELAIDNLINAASQHAYRT